MAKVIYVNAKTGKVEEKEEEIEIPEKEKPKNLIDLAKLKKLIEYAEKAGWI